MKDSAFASEAQLTYANILFYGCWVGLAIMAVTYVLYAFGIVTPHVPLEKMPELWGQPVQHYLREGNIPTGWGWVSLLGTGDFINFIGVVLLAGLSIICYLRIIPILLRNNNTKMAYIAVAEIIVLVLAASGLVGSGGH